MATANPARPRPAARMLRPFYNLFGLLCVFMLVGLLLAQILSEQEMQQQGAMWCWLLVSIGLWRLLRRLIRWLSRPPAVTRPPAVRKPVPAFSDARPVTHRASSPSPEEAEGRLAELHRLFLASERKGAVESDR